MYFISIFLIGAMLVFALLLKAKIYHPIVIMSTMWGLLILFHKMSSNVLYPASDKALLLITVGLLFFGFGSILEGYLFGRFQLKIGQKNILKKTNVNSYVLNTKMVIIIVIIAIIMMIPSAKLAYDYLKDGASLWAIRYILGSEIIYNRTISIFFSYVVNTTTYLVVPLSVYLILKKDKHAFFVMLITIILLSLHVLTKAGRLMLLYLLVSVAVVTLFGNKKINKKNILAFIGLSLGVLIVLVMVSDSRDTNFWKSMREYSVSSITFFSLKVEKFNLPYAHGGFSWYGIFSPIYNIIEILTGHEMGASVNNLIDYINRIDYINPSGETFNFFATSFFRFYGDGGTFCVILFSFIWGIICTFFYKKLCQNINLRSMFCYNLMVYGMATSVMSFIFADPGVVISLLLVYLVTKKDDAYEKT